MAPVDPDPLYTEPDEPVDYDAVVRWTWLFGLVATAIFLALFIEMVRFVLKWLRRLRNDA